HRCGNLLYPQASRCLSSSFRRQQQLLWHPQRGQGQRPPSLLQRPDPRPAPSLSSRNPKLENCNLKLEPPNPSKYTWRCWRTLERPRPTTLSPLSILSFEFRISSCELLASKLP